MSPPQSSRPCLPLQVGEWALGHCSAPTWCETAPLWHSACTFHGRRLPPPWPVCRRTPLTDPHCSCGGESVRVSGGQEVVRVTRPQLPRDSQVNSQLWGEDRIEHRLLEARGPQHKHTLMYFGQVRVPRLDWRGPQWGLEWPHRGVLNLNEGAFDC